MMGDNENKYGRQKFKLTNTSKAAIYVHAVEYICNRYFQEMYASTLKMWGESFCLGDVCMQLLRANCLTNNLIVGGAFMVF